MKKEEFFKIAKKLVECSKTVYLATFNKEYNAAETRAMANIRSKELYPENMVLFQEDDLTNFIITAASSEKVDQIRDNENVSLYYYCPKERKSLTLFGEMRVLEDNIIKDKLWEDEWRVFFNMGKEDPEYMVLQFIPKTAKYYTDEFERAVINL